MTATVATGDVVAGRAVAGYLRDLYTELWDPDDAVADPAVARWLDPGYTELLDGQEIALPEFLVHRDRLRRLWRSYAFEVPWAVVYPELGKVVDHHLIRVETPRGPMTRAFLAHHDVDLSTGRIARSVETSWHVAGINPLAG